MNTGEEEKRDIIVDKGGHRKWEGGERSKKTTLIVCNKQGNRKEVRGNATG